MQSVPGNQDVHSSGQTYLRVLPNYQRGRKEHWGLIWNRKLILLPSHDCSCWARYLLPCFRFTVRYFFTSFSSVRMCRVLTDWTKCNTFQCILPYNVPNILVFNYAFFSTICIFVSCRGLYWTVVDRKCRRHKGGETCDKCSEVESRTRDSWAKYCSLQI